MVERAAAAASACARRTPALLAARPCCKGFDAAPHVSLQPNGQAPVSSTARRAKGKTFTAAGFEDVSEPRALRLDELPGLIDTYRQAARHAIHAGFDGVEVHAANGYLLEQFLRDSINDRADAYGGSKENRARLLIEVMTAIVGEIGAGRTALRLSPVTPANDAQQDSDAQGLFNHVVEQLAPLKLACLHVVEGARPLKTPAALERRRLQSARSPMKKAPPGGGAFCGVRGGARSVRPECAAPAPGRSCPGCSTSACWPRRSSCRRLHRRTLPSRSWRACRPT